LNYMTWMHLKRRSESWIALWLRVDPHFPDPLMPQ
jgi:hypothetical protein